jgi:hypothetical protein
MLRKHRGKYKMVITKEGHEGINARVGTPSL